MEFGASAIDWAVFCGTVVAALGIDRLAFGRPKSSISFREAAVRSVFFVLVGTLFSAFVWLRRGSDSALTYLVAYVVEESLSVDNLFVFLVLFTYFRIGEVRQQRILFWGILGAVLMRGVFIVAGSALLAKFHFMMYVFGGFLIVTGAKLLFRKEETVDPEDNLALKLARRFLRTTSDDSSEQFFVVKDGIRYATPLFLVLIVVEFTDLLFAVDSVPAVLAISNDVFIVYTSNIMAILGLRALYFVLSGMMGRFHYLATGLSVILLFIGAKMVLSGFFHVSPLISLSVIVSVLAISVCASLLRPASEAGTHDG
ncbi:MAG TPA: TerC family protein [Polyangiaceae bacterium]|jgi:tellurite resistance protein TerC|nr:TerC family protein [Polyangiaceae bacterium]